MWQPVDVDIGAAYLAKKNAHNLDVGICFRARDHLYFEKGQDETDTLLKSAGYLSVTTLIHYFAPDFNEDEIIQKMMKNPKFPYEKKHEQTYGVLLKYKEKREWPSLIKESWEKNRNEASSKGTAMHLYLENYVNDLAYRIDQDPERPVTVDIEESDTVEIKYAKHYIQHMLNQGYVPFRTEWTLYIPELKLAGSIDLLWRHRDDAGRSHVVLADWKRSKEIKACNQFQRFHGQLDEFSACNLNNYTFQANMYARMLCLQYGVTVDSMHIVICHPDNTSYFQIPLELQPRVIDYMFQQRKAQLAHNVCNNDLESFISRGC